MFEMEFWKPRIDESLDVLEKERRIRVLYACESGSRAWGFPSPDSDFDVRFLYVHPIADYLRLGRRKDTLEWFADDGVLDFSGWDVKKTLELFLTCNLSLNEHLLSPCVYRRRETFARELAAMIPDYFQPVKGMFHYFSAAEHNRELLESSEPIKIKKLFYILRPLTACAWIWETGAMPPTEFVPHLVASPLSAGVKDEIRFFIESKKMTDERVPVPIPDSMRQEVRRLFQTMEERSQQAVQRFGKRNTPGAEPLETMFENLVLRSS